ncbi:MAG TPA: glycosyltransferase family 10, partial [Syntrophorhabdaceae bacterium]|nr:glycosyltransferase family 10 [Syntrophorhabdaceae bacterium]
SMTLDKAGVEEFRNTHFIFNIVYAHLRPEDIRAVHKENVSIIWTRFPIDRAHLYLYLNAYSYTGKKEGLNILLLSEPVIVLPGQYDPHLWAHFDHVITLYNSLIESYPEFSKFFYPRLERHTLGLDPDTAVTEDQGDRNRLYPTEGRINGICMINGNKQSIVPGELYSKRIEAALWFSRNSNLPFDVYGTPGFFLSNYKGSVAVGSRLATVSRYKYYLCFENTDHPELAIGYVEKILDCLEARTVPIYLGAPDIERYIPQGCFIDFRKFKDLRELDTFLTTMTDREYEEYIRQIDLFVTTGGLRRYSWDTLYDRLVRLFLKRTKGTDEDTSWEESRDWARGTSHLYDNSPLSEVPSEPLWTFSELAYGRSPLVRYDEQKPTFGGALSQDERIEAITELQREGRYEEAIDAFGYVGGGGNQELHYLFAQLLMLAGHYDAAQIHLHSVLSANKGHTKAYNDLGAISLMKGDFKEAVELFHKAISCDNKNYDALDNLMNTLTRLNLNEYAANFMTDAIKGSPFDDELRTIAKRYGISTHGTAGKADSTGSRSIQGTADRTLRAEPKLNDDVMIIAALERDGEYKKAIETLKPILAGDQDNADLHYLHARLLNAMGHQEAWVEELLKTVALNPNHSSAYNDLGCYHFGRGDHEQAYGNLRTAVFMDPHNYGALNNLIQFLLYLRSQGVAIDPVGVVKSLFPKGITDIGLQTLPPDAKRALVIHCEEAIPWFLSGMLDHFPYLKGHSMWWESVEMVRLLNKGGYIVDYVGASSQDTLNGNTGWSRYQLVIDGGTNNLAKFVPVNGQKRIFYSTGKHWLPASLAEIRRASMFFKRHNMHMPVERRQQNNFSDEYADYLTYFGNPSQLEGYSPVCKKVPLDISSVHIPAPRERDIKTARNNFIWLGGHGVVHKGLDLAVEAFGLMPEMQLHVCANLDIETRFLSWLTAFMKTHPNILYHGAQDVGSMPFEELAWGSIGTVYVSAAEGGPGSVAQLLQFGIIPIVTRTSNVRAENLGYTIEEVEDAEIIQGIVRSVRDIGTTSDEELRKRSQAVREFALLHHTRESYSKSFENLLLEING